MIYSYSALNLPSVFQAELLNGLARTCRIGVSVGNCLACVGKLFLWFAEYPKAQYWVRSYILCTLNQWGKYVQNSV